MKDGCVLGALTVCGMVKMFVNDFTFDDNSSGIEKPTHEF